MHHIPTKQDTHTVQNDETDACSSGVGDTSLFFNLCFQSLLTPEPT